jgi:hypothetical protein
VKLDSVAVFIVFPDAWLMLRALAMVSVEVPGGDERLTLNGVSFIDSDDVEFSATGRCAIIRSPFGSRNVLLD